MGPVATGSLGFQHTPVVITCREGQNFLLSKNLLFKSLEKGALKGLAVKISNYLSGGAIGNSKFAFLDLICQKEVTNVNGMGTFGRA